MGGHSMHSTLTRRALTHSTVRRTSKAPPHQAIVTKTRFCLHGSLSLVITFSASIIVLYCVPKMPQPLLKLSGTSVGPAPVQDSGVNIDANTQEAINRGTPMEAKAPLVASERFKEADTQL